MSTARPTHLGASYRLSMRCVDRKFMLTPAPGRDPGKLRRNRQGAKETPRTPRKTRYYGCADLGHPGHE